MKALLAILLILIGAQWALAIDTAPAFDDPVQQRRYERLARELRCLQCRSETIADSNAPLAGDLRRQLRELMAAGRSDAEIVRYMTDRYGDYVLYKPRLGPRTLLLWGAPILLVLGGGIAAGVVIARKSRLPDSSAPAPTWWCCQSARTARAPRFATRRCSPPWRHRPFERAASC